MTNSDCMRPSRGGCAVFSCHNSTKTIPILILLALLSALFLTACGGGGSGNQKNVKGIPPKPLKISSASGGLVGGALPGGVVGQAYGPILLAANGGVAPYTWSLVSGTLPSGLTLSTAGSIGGTPTVAATQVFRLRVKDSKNVTAEEN